MTPFQRRVGEDADGVELSAAVYLFRRSGSTWQLAQTGIGKGTPQGCEVLKLVI
jgi:hypothetical protein